MAGTETQLLLLEGRQDREVMSVLMAKAMDLGIPVEKISDQDIESLIRKVESGELAPQAAIIHLSLDASIAYKIIRFLPATTRRVMINDAGISGSTANTVALGLQADLVVNYVDFMRDPELLKNIVAKSYVTDAEIKNRGDTIEINGNRENKAMWPERDDMHGPRDYGDSDYVAKAKRGEGDR